MKLHMATGVAVAAIAVGFGLNIAIDAAPPRSGGLAPARAEPFNPALILSSICGRIDNGMPARRAYFARIGAAQASAAAPTDAAQAKAVRMLPVKGIGYPISTASAEAQTLFDAGLAHTWNFNHAEAIRAFKAAQERDPQCAMCFWGEAFALGPNINAPMSEEAVPPAYAAAQKSLALADGASAKERGLIEALAKRYAAEPAADRVIPDNAFADAMEALSRTYADDDFIASVATEANMDAQPWNYWEADGRTPIGRTARTVELIETVLARNPDHVAAIHLYIHITEATRDPWRAAEGADRLASLSPGLGHLIHMPSHTYYRIGRFRDSIAANIAAVEADEAYLAGGDAGPFYEFGYYVHNLHFVMASALMAGDASTTLALAEKLDAKLPKEMAVAVPFAQPIKAAPYYAMAQFGAPEDVLALEDPGADVPFLQAMRHYARGEALARQGDAEGARAEAAAMANLVESADLSGLVSLNIPAPDIMNVGRLTVLARAAAAEGDFAAAMAHMEQALIFEEALSYTEPPYWYYPARQTLGALALRAGQPERASQLFMETLVRQPNSSGALFGLSEAYRVMGDKNAARYARAMFRQSLNTKKADFSIERI